MYVKLFGSILDSSIWSESLPTKVLWITMLAMADGDGFVNAAMPGVAKRAGVTLDECRKALRILEGPDIESKNQDYAGRRIEKVEGGWLLLNYDKYREIRTEEQLKAAARQRRAYYRRKRETSRTSRTDTEAEADTEGEGEIVSPGEIISPGKESSLSSKKLSLPTKTHPVVVTTVTETLRELGSFKLQRDDLLAAQCFALFAYWAHKTKRRQGSTQLTLDRMHRLGVHIKQRGLDFCLYVCDGGVKHQDLNQDGRKHWGLDSFFPYNNADRLEKLVAITKFDERPVHPFVTKHPELGGGNGQ